jgi:hypothetical protein
VDDRALLERQAALQGEAASTVERLGLLAALGRVGRVIPLGSQVTGLMVWRDLDFAVEAPGLTVEAAFDVMLPFAIRASSLHYEHDRENERFYFVLRLDGWKLDVSLWARELPLFVEAFQTRLLERIGADGALRLTVLRLKEAWWRRPEYPEQVSAWQIYDAVLEHGVRTHDELDAYLGSITPAG